MRNSTVPHALLSLDARVKYQIVYELTSQGDREMKRFDVGARVVEPTYGLGSVIAVEDAYTRVQFDEHGVKKFLTSMSRLEPSDEPVPAGLRGAKNRKKRAPKKATVTATAPEAE